ncbi:hypothetical protein GFS31_05730 [Leptolyngbya sp. BL0902]|uniref:hypothetical protein n=1 Tax=Leptolyngbya sp. BL0902 TaxID=1115757 RepID=UPI0018E7C17E|nr:hypothetical protein [Leptolyngbya sp. BL0902]QQE63902.1 hypothetical protein GFS31_05730 [Leptolyngbya sp. BL0902]
MAVSQLERWGEALWIPSPPQQGRQIGASHTVNWEGSCATDGVGVSGDERYPWASLNLCPALIQRLFVP